MLRNKDEVAPQKPSGTMIWLYRGERKKKEDKRGFERRHKEGNVAKEGRVP
jgi:hypothetical protein